MPDWLHLPSEDDLKKLPKRAVLAYAVRCARRAQPLFRLASAMPCFADHERAIEHAIAVAEGVCRGNNLSVSIMHDSAAAAKAAAKAGVDVAEYAAWAAFTANAAARFDAWDVAQYAAKAALYAGKAAAAKAAEYAAKAAEYAAESSKSADEAAAAYREFCNIDYLDKTRRCATEVEAAKAAEAMHAAAVAAIEYAAKALGCSACIAALSDYQHLLELKLGVYQELGESLEPTENGPLGPLWPNESPEWFKSSVHT